MILRFNKSDMDLVGSFVTLRPAHASDRKKIFQWLTHSDVTASMMGPPDYPDHPIPTWEQFCDDYKSHFFNSSGDGKGRNYIIVVNEEDVGTIGYDRFNALKKRVELDIWLAAEKYCRLGYGSDALQTFCDYLHNQYGITTFVISPSARNKRAIAAYKKCGFHYVSLSKEDQKKEFGKGDCNDNIIMIKEIIEKC